MAEPWKPRGTAARGKQVLFFPARFDAHEVQAADGYAYQVAVQLFNQNYGKSLAAHVSTDAQGDWWGGAGGGTIAHAAIACFLGDTPETVMAFAATRPPEIPRIALVDFYNDCVGTSLAVMRRMFARWRELMAAGQESEARKFVDGLAELYGRSGDRTAGLELIEEAHADIRKTEARFWEADLHRIAGELQLSGANQAEAEVCFVRAIRVARMQGAKSFELRAATSLARLWRGQGKTGEAYDLLAPVYAWFTEGLDTNDLQEAKTLLDELS